MSQVPDDADRQCQSRGYELCVFYRLGYRVASPEAARMRGQDEGAMRQACCVAHALELLAGRVGASALRMRQS